MVIVSFFKHSTVDVNSFVGSLGYVALGNKSTLPSEMLVYDVAPLYSLAVHGSSLFWG